MEGGGIDETLQLAAATFFTWAKIVKMTWSQMALP
jgi:hypothetical protein